MKTALGLQLLKCLLDPYSFSDSWAGPVSRWVGVCLREEDPWLLHHTHTTNKLVHLLGIQVGPLWKGISIRCPFMTRPDRSSRNLRLKRQLLGAMFAFLRIRRLEGIMSFICLTVNRHNILLSALLTFPGIPPLSFLIDLVTSPQTLISSSLLPPSSAQQHAEVSPWPTLPPRLPALKPAEQHVLLGPRFSQRSPSGFSRWMGINDRPDCP